MGGRNRRIRIWNLILTLFMSISENFYYYYYNYFIQNNQLKIIFFK